ncbi:tetratricopeptide repeat protein [Pseudomonas sp. JS3066]|jgi:TPR repeat protein|uniref:tetratricopeptide repeat protein n=1 Tax=unclassified Pseudomonas TaxID=196821 RepID=UPI000EA9D19D|nr:MULTISPECIES: tetratricopeptide repeat protein [unclassified Pseudomonas]AYF90317.1 outer membrane assembly lipoprotein YfiO [Pseudomonas sp. DY-1]MDH4652562.1 tetratricopeptide repeat protein [Pseudomonas sp. BN606]MRK20893.1 tetratricopeptide repeat protein [Pseudomonas sp. JG-B]WVK92106.1 tetratricopeptide repeat protein [Pseudomonas sp. JS3066]
MHSTRPTLLALCLLLGACSPTTPLFIAQVTTNEVVEYKTMKSNRMAAAVEEEGDLLTYSAMAIRDAKSPEAEELYLVGYRDDKFSDDVRAISLYQIGLIYMSRYNEQRNDAKALGYLERVLDEFPSSRAAQRAEARILVIRQRAGEPVQKTSRELLATWQPSNNLDLYKPGLDPDMTLLSRRAVLKDRVAEAEELYLLALSDAHVQPDIKEKALYQLGLMYLAPDNPHASRDKAIGYFRRLLVQFPDSDLASKASQHLDQALNQSRP